VRVGPEADAAAGAARDGLLERAAKRIVAVGHGEGERDRAMGGRPRLLDVPGAAAGHECPRTVASATGAMRRMGVGVMANEPAAAPPARHQGAHRTSPETSVPTLNPVAC